MTDLVATGAHRPCASVRRADLERKVRDTRIPRQECCSDGNTARLHVGARPRAVLLPDRVATRRRGPGELRDELDERGSCLGSMS